MIDMSRSLLMVTIFIVTMSLGFLTSYLIDLYSKKKEVKKHKKD